jgi:hypothetical protein
MKGFPDEIPIPVTPKPHDLNPKRVNNISIVTTWQWLFLPLLEGFCSLIPGYMSGYRRGPQDPLLYYALKKEENLHNFIHI